MTEKNIKLEDLVGIDDAKANIVTEYELKKKFSAIANWPLILQDKIAEYNNRIKNLTEFEKSRKKTDPNYSVSDYQNNSDVIKFGLRWFHYEHSMAKRRGQNTNFVVSGVTYHLSADQDTLVMAEHYPLLKNWAAQNHFNNNPGNINNLYGQPFDEIAKKIAK